MAYHMARWVIADDTSSDVKYQGSWFSDVGSSDARGTPYLSTLHGTSSNASFTFNFTGSAVRVVGSRLAASSIYWTCLVDGAKIMVTSGIDNAGNNFVFCYSDSNSLDDGHHTLTVNTTISNQTFWLDRIDYVPSQQVSLEQKAIGVGIGDSELDSSAITVFVFPFYGVSVSWYGTIYEADSGNLSWSMDDFADPHFVSNWSVPTVSNSSYPLVNQKLFESPTYPIGLHTLKVTYLANRKFVLGFDYLIVQNGTVPSQGTSASSSPDSSTTSTGIAHATSGTRRVMASVVTSVVLVSGIAVLVFYFFSRRLNAKRRIWIDSDELVFPFNQTPAYIALTPQTHPVQWKSRMLPIHSRFNASTANLPPSGRSHTLQTDSNPVPNGLGTHNIGDGRQQQPLSSAQQDVAVDVGQGSFSRQPETAHVQPTPGSSRIVIHQDSGIRLNREASRTHTPELPPEYTMD